ncbi:flagellin [Heyndrickxia coagulans]|uniref:flagellin N-terminal helical domain-containing protein n=1 Tax=Heyndrickxia coagulans TaxID=1398 RepID=UPI0015C6792E|nr:flagellin [Heyndrickxia coagulans]
MIINHNIAALNTLNHLNAATNAQSKAMQKLSSGLRINSAADDAAGLAISEKMRGQIRGLDKATSNAQDSISMIQTAEGALNETTDILQRMRELAVQAGNDTNTSEDREEIQKEVNQLTSEVNRIANTTEFNTQKLLNASAGKTTAAGSATNFDSEQTAAQTGIKYQGTFTGTSDESLTLKFDKNNSKYQYSTDGGTTFNDITWDGSKKFTYKGLTLSKPDTDPTAEVTDTAITLTAASGAKSSFTSQIGANENQTMTLEFTDMRAASLGITGSGSGFTTDNTVTDGTNNTANEKALDVSNSANAGNAVTKIQNAIDKVSSERAKLGAYENRLDHTINNLTTSSENMSSAESRIRDVDYALAA